MLRLQRPRSERAAETGISTVTEGAVSVSDLAGRQDQDQHLRAISFRVRAAGRVRWDLVRWLPQTTAHSAASAIRSAAAAGRASSLKFLGPPIKRLCRNRSANHRHAGAHREQRDNEGTDWFRLVVHAVEYTARCDELFDKSYNRQSLMAINLSRAAKFDVRTRFDTTPNN